MHVDAPAKGRFEGCRIRDFVPLLIERAATRTLDATNSRHRRNPNRCTHLNFPPPAHRAGGARHDQQPGRAACLRAALTTSVVSGERRWPGPGEGPVSAAAHHTRAV
ncbi:MULTISPECIES: three-helix bundle dimerization domain-containing protein [Rhodococcus]|uniref:three-helix bundle dimerization domain-containing protein n=1 Tax=Rhodococcus TaxID=1827 RepID=UPI000A313D07